MVAPTDPGVRTRPPRVRTPRRVETGAVTAEAVVVVPALVALTLGLVWLLALATAQVRVVDAAREVARAVARDEPLGAAVTLGRRVAPRGARITVREAAGLVEVGVRARVAGPGGLLAFLPAPTVAAEAVAASEELPP